LLGAADGRQQQQVPPLRRRWRSGSGRDDRVFVLTANHSAEKPALSEVEGRCAAQNQNQGKGN